MKAISLWQPWASLIAAGVKTIETRSWAPPASLIGQRIAIHAAKRRVSSADVVFNELVAEELGLSSVMCSSTTALRNALPRGAVVCTAVLDSAHRVERLRPGKSRMIAECEQGSRVLSCCVDPWGDFEPGRWLWFLRDVEVLPEPFEAVGRQRVFSVDLSLSSPSGDENKEGGSA